MPWLSSDDSDASHVGFNTLSTTNSFTPSRLARCSEMLRIGVPFTGCIGGPIIKSPLLIPLMRVSLFGSRGSLPTRPQRGVEEEEEEEEAAEDEEVAGEEDREEKEAGEQGNAVRGTEWL